MTKLQDIYDRYSSFITMSFNELYVIIKNIMSFMTPYDFKYKDITGCKEDESILCYFANNEGTVKVFVNLFFDDYADTTQVNISYHKKFYSFNGSLEKCLSYCQKVLEQKEV